MRKEAQSLIEYALILVLITIISLQVLGKFGISISKVGNKANAEVNNTDSIDSYCKKIGCNGYDPGSGTCLSCPTN